MHNFFGCMWLAGAAAAAMLIFIAIVESRRMRKARNWPTAVGTVTASSVQGRENKPFVEYEFEVAGQKYRSSRITMGEPPSQGEAASILARYPVGASVTVYYDPADPHMATLERAFPRWVWKVVGWIVLLLVGVPPLAWLLFPPLFFNSVLWLRPHLVNPGSAEWVSALLGIGLVVVVFSIGCTGVVWQACRWPTTRGRVVSTGVRSFEFSSGEGSSSTRYKPNVVYRYEVNSQQYSGDKVNYDLLASGMSESYAQKIAAQYQVGQEVTVYYNPKNPADSMLNPQARWHYIPWVVAACIFGLAWAIATGVVQW
jgi:hypothetical protein